MSRKTRLTRCAGLAPICFTSPARSHRPTAQHPFNFSTQMLSRARCAAHMSRGVSPSFKGSNTKRLPEDSLRQGRYSSSGLVLPDVPEARGCVSRWKARAQTQVRPQGAALCASGKLRLLQRGSTAGGAVLSLCDELELQLLFWPWNRMVP